ncbi:MAG: hypothetical protein HRU20_15255 [Pseudomonadales bacterium]|nr:hypothetical protein [Pseudomonadales bacterium]
MNKVKIIIRSTVFFLFVAVLLVQAFPQVLFSKETKLENITVFSNKGISKGLELEINQSIKLLEESPFYDKGSDYKVFIADRGFIYSLLGPDYTSGSFARTNIFNKVIIRECNKKFDTCYSKSKEYNERSLNGLIAHEITHINIRSKFGYIREYLIPAWKKEGVSDYISQSSSYTGTGKHEAKAYEYYVYRSIAAYAIETKGIEISDYLEMELDFEQLKLEYNENP